MPKAVERAVLSLESTNSLHTPLFVTVNLLKRFEPVYIVHIGIDWSLWLALIPKFSDLLGPFPTSLLQTWIIGWNNDLHEHELSVVTEEEGRRVGVPGLHSLGGITFMEHNAPGGESGVAGDSLRKIVKSLALRCHVVDLKACSGGDAGVAMLADEGIFVRVLCR